MINEKSLHSDNQVLPSNDLIGCLGVFTTRLRIGLYLPNVLEELAWKGGLYGLLYWKQVVWLK